MTTAHHRELELKAVVPDPDELRRRLAAAGAETRYAGRMTDVRFDRGGELTARDEVLRVRTFEHADRVESVVAWKGPTLRSSEGYKLREEIELPLAPTAAEPGRLLAALGYVPVSAIERLVEVFALGGATVRLEIYPRMDVLLEVEGDPEAIERAIAATGIPRDEFTPEPLGDFVRRFEERSGRPAALAG